MPLTNRAQAMLRAFHAGELANEIAFHKALGQANLDYTPDSLDRIDRLLRQMHTQLKPQYDAFVGVPPNDNFLLLLAYYIGTVIARFTLQRIEWYSPEELEQVLSPADLGNIEACFQSSITCTFLRDGELTGFFLPLAPIHDILFEGDATRSVAASAAKYLRRAISVPMLRHPPAGFASTSFASDRPGGIGEALHRLGLLAGSQAAWACSTALECGANLAPQLHHEYADRRRQINSLLFIPPDEAFDRASQQLDSPEPDVVGTAFAYDGNINLPRFRTNALVIEARWYAPDLRVAIAVPYRNAGKSEGFALYSPRVLEMSFAEGYLPVFETAFFAGIDSFNPPGLWAARYLDEDDPANLAARMAEQEAVAYPAESDPFAEIRFDSVAVAAGIAELPPNQADYAEVATPWWAEEDGLAELFRDMPALLREGRVVWGQLIQANTRLFENGHEDGLPGDVLYDPAGLLTPTDLAPIARGLFASRQEIEALRDANPPQPDRLLLAEHFNNELSRARALRIPPGDGHGELLVSSTYFVRRHLPTETLMLPYFPLLILDGRPGSVMVLPSRWWPQPLLEIWSGFLRDRRRDSWQKAWAKLATGREEDDEDGWRKKALDSLQEYALRGVADQQVMPWMSSVNADGSRKDYYTGDFRPDTEPPPREWEWGLGGTLTSLAEHMTRDLECGRARGQPLDVQLARLAYGHRHIGLMIELHTRLLAGRRGCEQQGGSEFWPDEIQWAALGLVAGCEQPALRTARILCSAWRYPEIYFDIIRPEVLAVFVLFSRQLGIRIPELIPCTRLPALEALISTDRWLDPDISALAPLVEAACVEHTEEAPNGPFLGLPIAIALLFKLRAMRGFSNPAVKHPLLAVPLGDWAGPVDFEACLDPLLHTVRDRLGRHGFDEEAIAAAVIDGTPLEAPRKFARPALAPNGASRAAENVKVVAAEPGMPHRFRERDAEMVQEGEGNAKYVPDPALAHLKPFSVTEEGLLWFQQKDYDRARAAWERSALTGNAGGLHGLSMLYESGLGVPKDPARALEFYERAAAKDYGSARQAIARMRGESASAAGRGQVGKSLTSSDVDAWEHKAVDGFKTRLAEPKIRRTLLELGCPPDHADLIVERARLNVRRLRRVEGVSTMFAGVVLLFLTRAMLVSQAYGNRPLLLGLLGGVLAVFGAYKIFTGERGYA